MSKSFSDKQTIECQFTAEELAKIDAIAQLTGQSRSQWFYNLVKGAIGEINGNAINAIATKVAALELEVAKVSRLEQQLADLTKTVEELRMYSPTIPQYGTPPTTGTYRAEPGNAAILVDDEIEDEPDEILLDFLTPPGNAS
jgi:hypothetical protein